MQLIHVKDEVIYERFWVSKALEDAVHEAGVAQILQSRETTPHCIRFQELFQFTVH